MKANPLYVLGPCAAESREQVMETAKQIADYRSLVIGDWSLDGAPFIFRAGVWKPRSRPDTFQGAGEEGLKWLQEVKAAFGVPVATEVATPEHVQAALEAGIDYLWIGARTSANPIAVEKISESIRNNPIHPKGLLIKNPVNADAELWLGNIERLEKTGVPVIAVHRGCNHQPCWSMAHKVRTARPDIPMLLDPSHMSGDAKQVPALLEKVAELGLDGAMVEVHTHPEFALSDRKQQIRPDEIGHWSLVNGHLKDTELNWLRAEIDELDEQLWSTIAARMDVSRRIGEWKKAHGVAPLQPERYQQIIERIQKTDRYADRIQTDFAIRLYDLIHEESLKQQK